MSTRSGRTRPSAVELSPPRTRKGISPPRSPARNRKSSPPARSPSRKSPSRKSPSRKPVSKFPARKSPSRATKESTDTTQKSPGKRPAIKNDVQINLVDVTSKMELFRSTRPRRSEYSIKDLTTSPPLVDFISSERVNGVDAVYSSSGRDVHGLRNRKTVEEIIPRRSGRLLENEIKRSQSKSVSKSVSQSIETISDSENSEEDLKKEKSKSLTRKLATPLRESISRLTQYSGRWEFGGRVGSAILVMLIPLTVFSILLSCSKNCTMKTITDLTSYKSISVWFSLQAFALIAAQIVIQALFACLPVLGAKADQLDGSGKKYSFNAFFASIVTVTLLFTLDFFKVLNADTLLNDYLKLATASYIFGVILAVALFVKSRKLDDSQLNPYGNTGFSLYDFWIGREIHPNIRKLNIKIWVSRICNINALILAVLIFKNGLHVPLETAENITLDTYKETLSKVQLKPTILLYSMMQLLYILNFIMGEYKITSTFYWNSEGIGYLQAVTSSLYPFYFTTIAKFVSDQQLELSANILIGASVIYLVGFFIMLISNNVKHEFRKNPLEPSVSHLESMPTFHGKKLLVSSLWGKLRHPNYTGDILVHIALALPGLLTKQYVAATPALLTILTLLHRAWRDHARCKRRYGAAWQRYCKRVPSLVLPKVL